MSAGARATSLTVVRIGEVTRKTGLTARMIRYYEHLGRIRSPSRGPRAHRNYAEDDIERLRVLRALLAAGVSPAEVIDAIDGRLDIERRRRITASLDQLHDATRDALRCLRQSEPVEPLPTELRIGLLFDLFLARTRAEALLTLALRPVGLVSGELALLHLVWLEGQFNAATLARLVGVAPSTLGGRLNRLLEQGLIRRRPDPDNARSWILELTTAGVEKAQASLRPMGALYEQLEAALASEGFDVDHVRDVVLGLSAALRTLLPDQETHRQAQQSASPDHG
jgi:DNA-binding transcriptional MerR regulator/DNA-binding HxlR family transcriptional regulator